MTLFQRAPRRLPHAAICECSRLAHTSDFIQISSTCEIAQITNAPNECVSIFSIRFPVKALAKPSQPQRIGNDGSGTQTHRERRDHR